MATTPNYSLSIYNSSDTDVRFLDFRVAIAGTQTTSNFYVIDGALKEHSDAINTLKNSPQAYIVKANFASGIYNASVSGFTGYKANQLIILSLNQTNTGSVSININNSSNKNVMLYSDAGTLRNAIAGEFVENSAVLCYYDGTQFVAVGVPKGSAIYVDGEQRDILQISSSGAIESSGKQAGQPNGIATLDSDGKVEQVAKIADGAASGEAVYSGNAIKIPYVSENRIASITAYGETPQGGTTEAPVALTGITSVKVNDDVTALPIPRPLRRVGNVKDKCVTRQDYESAEKLVVTYNVGFVELNGTEASHIFEGMFYLDYTPVWPTPANRVNGVCSHYPYGAYGKGKIGLTDNGAAVVYNPNGDYTGDEGGLANWKAYLAAQKEAGTPVQVVYQLATPEQYATDPIDFNNDAGPLTVVTGGQVEVKMTDFVTDRTPAFLNKLDKTGDGSDVTVTFTEASTDTDIASGDKLSILFGKILKRFSTITSKFTTVEGDISDIVDGTTTVANATTAATADKVKNKLSLLSGGGQDTIIYDGSTAIAAAMNSSFIGAEPAFIKNSAFNKNFGSSAGTVCQGNDGRLSDARRSSNISMSLSGTNLSISYS